MNELEIMTNFAANLRARRKALHLTQKAFGDMIGYSEKTVSKWESAAAVAPSVVLPLLASVLKVTVDDLFRESNVPAYYLGIYGGSSQSEFLLTDLNGNVINRIVLDGCNPVDIGLTRMFEILEEGICKACSGCQLSEVSAYAGIAGAMTGDYLQSISSFLKRFGFISYNSGGMADIALLALGDREGVMVIAGTGSVAYVRIGDEIRRIGGYGILFGDDSGSYGIGRAVIHRALEAEAGGKENSLLLHRVRELCGTPRVEDSLKKFYTGGKGLITSYAPLAFEAFRLGDSAAEAILRETARKLAKLVLRGQEMFGGRPVPVVIVGDLVKRNSVLLSMIEEALPRQYASRLSVNERPLIWGALQMAGLPESCIEAET